MLGADCRDDWREFHNLADLVEGESFAFGLDAFLGDELEGVDLLGGSPLVGAPVGEGEERMVLAGDGDESALGVLADEVDWSDRKCDFEAFDVVEAGLGIDIDGGPDLVGVEFLDSEYVIVEVLLEARTRRRS